MSVFTSELMQEEISWQHIDCFVLPLSVCRLLFFRYKEIAGSLENAISDGLEAAPGVNTFYLERLCVPNILPAVTNVYFCLFISSWQCIPPAGIWGVVVMSSEMLVRQSLSVTSGSSPLEAHVAALRTICQVSWWGKLKINPKNVMI